MNNLNGLPFFYDHRNVANSLVDPSSIHCSSTGLAMFFKKYLMERAMSVYQWKLPKEFNPYYFKWVLFTCGFIGLFNDPKFGSVAQWCNFEDYNIYYYPKYALFTNPAFGTKVVKKEIDKDCVLLNLKGDFTGVYDIVSFYADQLAVLYESFGLNALQAKNTDIFGADDKKIAEEMKKVVDLVISGKPAVFTTNKLFREDGSLAVAQFKQAKDFFGNELLSSIDQVIKNFDAEIGIPTANTKKKERLISDEVNSQKYEAMSRSEMWLEDLQNECKKAKELLNIDIDVSFRYNVFDELANVNEGGDGNVAEL